MKDSIERIRSCGYSESIMRIITGEHYQPDLNITPDVSTVYVSKEAEDPWNIFQSIRVLTLSSNTQGAIQLTTEHFSAFDQLVELIIDDSCFENVKEVKLNGLSTLERLVIGNNSFTRNKNGYGKDSNCRFSLKDCGRLKELKIGRYSFSDYAVCEIENMDSLEVIEIGELNYVSCNFFSASLQIKSEHNNGGMMNRITEVEIPSVW